MKNKYIYVIAGGVVLLALLTRKKLSKKMSSVTEYILKKEGGLSNNPKDSASKYPSPTLKKWHTNKGITYKTFVDNASKLGYTPSVNNFITMPPSIWQAIWEKIYLPKGQKTKNPILNNFLAYWYWQGWDKKLLPETLVNGVLLNNISDKQKLRQLTDLRIKYYKNLVAAVPKNAEFLKGWINSAEDFYNTFSTQLS